MVPVAASSRRPLGAGHADGVAAGVAACLVGLVIARFGFELQTIVAAFFVSVLVVLSRIDIERRILPNRIVLPAAAAILAAQLAFFPDRAVEWLLAPLAASLLLFLPLLVYPSGMGMGDVKLALLLGAALGQAVVPALVLGFLFVFPVALFIVLRGGASARKVAIPFGPFLSTGAVVALFLVA
jgi:leader peptidase (prepilin peptidase)/N-methyltransferase